MLLAHVPQFLFYQILAAVWPPTCTGIWTCSFLSAGLCYSPCLILWDSCLSTSTILCPSGWHNDLLVYQSLSFVLNVHSAPLSRSLMKALKYFPQFWSGSTSLVTNFQVGFYCLSEPFKSWSSLSFQLFSLSFVSSKFHHTNIEDVLGDSIKSIVYVTPACFPISLDEAAIFLCTYDRYLKNKTNQKIVSNEIFSRESQN